MLPSRNYKNLQSKRGLREDLAAEDRRPFQVFVLSASKAHKRQVAHLSSTRYLGPVRAEKYSAIARWTRKPLVKSSSQVTQFIQLSICFRCRSKLYLFDGRTIHVRWGIYRVIVFIFYIKWLFYSWPKYL
jgi:hypothetical protein